MRKIIATRCDICTYVFVRAYKIRTMETIVSINIGSVPDAYSARTIYVSKHVPWKAPFRPPGVAQGRYYCSTYRSKQSGHCGRVEFGRPTAYMKYVERQSLNYVEYNLQVKRSRTVQYLSCYIIMMHYFRFNNYSIHKSNSDNA